MRNVTNSASEFNTTSHLKKFKNECLGIKKNVLIFTLTLIWKINIVLLPFLLVLTHSKEIVFFFFLLNQIFDVEILMDLFISRFFESENFLTQRARLLCVYSNFFFFFFMILLFPYYSTNYHETQHCGRYHD